MMAGKTSGKRAVLGLDAANHDPEPWRCTDWQWITNHPANPCRSAEQNRHNCAHDLRPQFDVGDNPILTQWREEGVPRIVPGNLDATLGDALLGDDAREWWNPAAVTDDDIDQARRVLTKMAAHR